MSRLPTTVLWRNYVPVGQGGSRPPTHHSPSQPCDKWKDQLARLSGGGL